MFETDLNKLLKFCSKTLQCFKISLHQFNLPLVHALGLCFPFNFFLQLTYKIYLFLSPVFPHKTISLHEVVMQSFAFPESSHTMK